MATESEYLPSQFNLKVVALFSVSCVQRAALYLPRFNNIAAYMEKERESVCVCVHVVSVHTTTTWTNFTDGVE